MIFRKIVPLNRMFPGMITGDDRDKIRAFVARNVDKIREQIGAAIVLIGQVGYSHGDVSLDNIGYDGERFVLFDFDRASAGVAIDRDMASLERSIAFWLGDAA